MCKVFFFCCAPLGAATFRRGQSKKKTPPRVFFVFCSGAATFRRGRSKKKNALGGVFFFFAAAPPKSRGAGAKKKHPGWCFFFFALAPPKGRGAQRSATKKKHFAHPGPTAKNFLETNDAGHEQKGATTKKKTPKNTTQGVFFFFAPAPPKSRGARAKKKTPPRVFLFAPAPRLFGGAGAKKKKNTLGGVFFLLRPRADAHSLTAGLGSDASPSPGWCFFFAAALPGPGWCFFFAVAPGGVFFFALAPCRRPTGLLLPLPFPGAGAKKKTPWVVFFFLLWPRAGTQRGFSFACLSPGPQQKKKHPGWCVFFCSGPVPAPNGVSPSLAFRRGRSKKKTPWVVFFFLLRPRADAHSLTAGLGGDASPSPGWCFFFFAAAPPGPGGCFFFCCGPARTLTHSRWAGAISARPGWCFFFCCGPAGSF